MTTTIFREKRLPREQETKRKIAAVLNKIYREVSIKGRPVKEISVVALVDELRQEEMVGTKLGKGLSHTNNELWLSVCDGHRLPTAEDVDRIAEAITSYNKGCWVNSASRKAALAAQTVIEHETEKQPEQTGEGMTLAEYQERAMSTCMRSCANFAYMSFGMAGEMGELASKVAKAIRKEKAYIGGNTLVTEWGREQMTDEEIDALKAELGDIIWFVAGLARVMDWDLEDVARGNLQKLAARKKAGTISGDGDGISGEGRTRA